MAHEVTVGSSSNLCVSFLASVVVGDGGTNEGRQAATEQTTLTSIYTTLSLYRLL